MTMKTIFSILSVLALIVGAIAADAYHPDFADWSVAAMVAVMFGLALNDRRAPARVRPQAG